MLELRSNMEFEIKSSFIPNFSNSSTLRILDVSQNSVIVKMNESQGRGVFPVDHFQYWIKRNSLIYINDIEERTS